MAKALKCSNHLLTRSGRNKCTYWQINTQEQSPLSTMLNSKCSKCPCSLMPAKQPSLSVSLYTRIFLIEFPLLWCWLMLCIRCFTHKLVLIKDQPSRRGIPSRASSTCSPKSHTSSINSHQYPNIYTNILQDNQAQSHKLSLQHRSQSKTRSHCLHRGQKMSSNFTHISKPTIPLVFKGSLSPKLLVHKQRLAACKN